MAVIAQKVPTEILFNIFQHLSKETIIEACVVCRSWKRAAQYTLFRDVTLTADKKSIKNLIATVQAQTANSNANLGSGTKALTLNVLPVTEIEMQDWISESDSDLIHPLSKELPCVKSIDIVETQPGAIYDNWFLAKSMENWSDSWEHVERLNMHFCEDPKQTRIKDHKGNETLFKMFYSFRNSLTHLSVDSSRSPVMPSASEGQKVKGIELLSHFTKLENLKVVNHKPIRDISFGDEDMSLGPILKDCPKLVNLDFCSMYPISEKASRELCSVKKEHTEKRKMNKDYSAPLINPGLKNLKIVLPGNVKPYVDYLMSEHSGNYDSFNLTLLLPDGISVENILKGVICEQFAEYSKQVKDLNVEVIMANPISHILYDYELGILESTNHIPVEADHSLLLPGKKLISDIWDFIRVIDPERNLNANYKLTFDLADNINHFMQHRASLSTYISTNNFETQPTLFSLKTVDNKHLFLEHYGCLEIAPGEVYGQHTYEDYVDCAKRCLLPSVLGAFDHDSLGKTKIDNFDVSLYLNTNSYLILATMTEFLKFVVSKTQTQRIGTINLETYGIHRSKLTPDPTFRLRHEIVDVCDKNNMIHKQDKLSILAMPTVTNKLIQIATDTLEFKEGILHIQRYPPVNSIYSLNGELEGVSPPNKQNDMTLDLAEINKSLEELQLDIHYKHLCYSLENPESQCNKLIVWLDRGDKLSGIRYIYRRQDVTTYDGNINSSEFVLHKRESVSVEYTNRRRNSRTTAEIKIKCGEVFMKKLVLKFVNEPTSSVSLQQTQSNLVVNSTERVAGNTESGEIVSTLTPLEDLKKRRLRATSSLSGASSMMANYVSNSVRKVRTYSAL